MKNSATKLFFLSEKKKLFFLVLNILFFFTASAQVFFELKFGTALDDRARNVRQMQDGSIYVAGFSNAGPNGGFDIVLTKLTPSGNIMWTKYYGKSIDEYLLYMNLTSDNNFILCGESHGMTSGVDAWIMKIDTAGGIVWSNGLATVLNESFKYVEETSDGGFITCGFQSDTSSSNDILIVKTDSVGDIEWQKTYGGNDNDYADAIRQTPDGGYLVSADTRSFGLPDYDIYMLKIDSAGSFVWDNFSGGPLADGCQGFIITSDNKYLTFGESIVNWGEPFQYFLQLADSSGNVIWEKYIGGLGADAAFSAVETSDGGFMLTGYSSSNNSGINTVIFKISNQGDSLWSQYYGGAGIDIGYHIIECIGGGYLIAGTTWNNDNDFHLLKVDEYGIVARQDDLAIPVIIRIFPNPSSGNFKVKFSEPTRNPMLSLFSEKGEEIFRKAYKGQYKDIDFSPTINKGIYFVKITGEELNFNSKIIIE